MLNHLVFLFCGGSVFGYVEVLYLGCFTKNIREVNVKSVCDLETDLPAEVLQLLESGDHLR